MRQLFVPACLYLMTLSGSVGDDPKMSTEQFTGAPKPIQIADESKEALPAVTDIADLRKRVAAETVGAAPVDTPIAIPQQGETSSTPTDNATASVEPAPLPKAKPEIKPVVHRSKEEVCDTVARAAQSNGLPVPFFIRLLFQESRFSPGVVSHAGAQGIAQFMPDTASDMGVDNPFDPLQAIPASARLLRNLFERFGNLGLAAAAYNAGPKRIQDWLAKKGSLPQETQGYVKTITGRPAENWRGTENGAPAVKLPRHAPCQEAAGLMAWNGPDEIPTPITAPHRRPKEAEIVVAKSGRTKDEKETKIIAKGENGRVKLARQGTRMMAVIKVADGSGGLPSKAKGKRDESKIANKKDIAKKAGKGALQLAARKQNKRDKKLRLSER